MFERVFQEFGLPAAMRTDNGVPFASAWALYGLSKLAVWWLPNQNPFVGTTTRPSDSDLEKALGRAKPLWDQLVAELASEQGVTTREWKSYSPKHGWSLRLMRGKRTIVWLAPYSGVFQVLFIFGESAIRSSGESQRPRDSADELKWSTRVTYC